MSDTAASHIISTLFNTHSKDDFASISMQVFQYQLEHNELYRRYVNIVKPAFQRIKHVSEIPFLPIEFFKTHSIVSSTKTPQVIFESSGTTGTQTSKHAIADLDLYHRGALKTFTSFYGELTDTCLIAFLPSYKDRSSLIHMAKMLISTSKHPDSGFYTDETQIATLLHKNKQQQQRCILLGVSFALLRLAERFPQSFPDLIVIETGGMKGRREEITRSQLHKMLQTGFGTPNIHSEYGMTELLSQAYANNHGIFTSPPWMQIYIRDLHDPFTFLSDGKRGAINIIDLANIYSCSFIATQDMGIRHDHKRFEVLGRTSNSDLRGCNLLFEESN